MALNKKERLEAELAQKMAELAALEEQCIVHLVMLKLQIGGMMNSVKMN